MIMRDDNWLVERVEQHCLAYFSQLKRLNPIAVKFAIHARNKYGSIQLKGNVSYIRVNHLYALPEVPEFVVDETLIHELIHYSHGFGSTLTKKFLHPHRGGVIEKEFVALGIESLMERASEWRTQHWDALYNTHYAERVQKSVQREEQVSDLWENFCIKNQCLQEDSLLKRYAHFHKKLCLESDKAYPVEWLYANQRQNGLSYFYPYAGIVRIHALLAHPKVPRYVLDVELAYWVAHKKYNGNKSEIQNVLHRIGLTQDIHKALDWKAKHWENFRVSNHPTPARP